jgi:MoaA/NifB/PqqE/SkfB family radical SAM enzyme
MPKFLSKIKNLCQRRKGGYFGNEFVAILGLTYSCQCDCVHCGMSIYPKNSEKELKTNDWIKIIEAISPKKVDSLMFFGGEPLLRKDLPELISVAKKRGFKTALDTNGWLLAMENVKILKRSGLYMVEISVDSLDSQIHDRLRGVNGVFKKVQEGIENCLSEKLNFSISTYATKENIQNGNLETIILWAKKIGASYVRVLSPILAGKWLNEEELKLNRNDIKKLNKFIDGQFAFLENNPCHAINKKFIYISPYGDIQPCPYVPFSFGNIKKDPLEKLLKKMWDHQMFKIKTKECLMNNEKFRNDYIKNIKNTQKLPINSRIKP